MRRLVIWVSVFTVVAVIAFTGNRTDPLPDDARADRIVVDKSRRVLLLYSRDTLLKTYKIALGSDPEAPEAAFAGR